MNGLRARGLTIGRKSCRITSFHSEIGRAGVTQLAECLLPKQNVVGSNPIARSRMKLNPDGLGFFIGGVAHAE